MNKPLNGVRILDLTHMLSGPYGAMILADLGAEVTRVESPTRPDLIRALPPQVEGRSQIAPLISEYKSWEILFKEKRK